MVGVGVGVGVLVRVRDRVRVTVLVTVRVMVRVRDDVRERVRDREVVRLVLPGLRLDAVEEVERLTLLDNDMTEADVERVTLTDKDFVREADRLVLRDRVAGEGVRDRVRDWEARDGDMERERERVGVRGGVGGMPFPCTTDTATCWCPTGATDENLCKRDVGQE